MKAKRTLGLMTAFCIISGGLWGCSSRQATDSIQASSHSLSEEGSLPQNDTAAYPDEPEKGNAASKTPGPGNTNASQSDSVPPAASLPEQKETGSYPKKEDTEFNGTEPIEPWAYQSLLGKGMDVDWSKTKQGRKFYNRQTVEDFKAAGISHVRIRIADDISPELLEGLDRQIQDCLECHMIPVIAYQADAFKNNPTEKNIKRVVSWWSEIAQHYRDISHLLAFDLLIEATDSLNKQPEKLNEIYELLVAEIRESNPTRIIMISPRLRSDAAYLSELEIPSQHNGYLMAEWHFYASGPSKTNERKLWTTGTESERALITEKIEMALSWQQKTGIPTWVGAWMPGNYNDGNDYSIEEQVQFASYMTEQLLHAGIPFSVNSDTKFYDRETNQWIADKQPVFQAIYR